jgi:multisubunit Na+/H+ antiporter MnhE subunit
MSRFLLAVALLVAVYALTLASAQPADLATGAVAASAVLAGLRGFHFPGGLRPIPGLARRALALPAFVAVTVREVTAGTWAVAMVTLGVRAPRSPGMVEIPLGERTPVGVTVTALAVTLSPGEVLVDVDFERGVMLLHAIDADDPAALAAHHQRLYERYQRAVFP